ncbi:MAG: pilus assembly protein PilP [Holophagales bacterium]|nr:pilus assembly protein PilP [Holophagales bacterium]
MLIFPHRGRAMPGIAALSRLSSSLPFVLVAVLGLALTIGTAPLHAQEGDTSSGEESEEGDSLEEQGLRAPVDFAAIDDLLESDEEVLSDPETYSYDPGARRDPFISLLEQRDSPEVRDKRPDGIAGLLIEELRVEGIFVLDQGPVAQVKAASQETSFLLRPGDGLWDGDVVRIDLEEVVFKQSVNDPTSLKPFREVTKRLNPAQAN